MKYHKYCIFIMFALLQGCDSFVADDGSYLETGIAEEGLIFNFQEHHADPEGSDPELFLNLETQKLYPCTNTSIENNIWMSDTHIDIDLVGVEIPSYCLPAFGPSNALIPFSVIQGNRVLEIREGNLIDQFEINVTREMVEITPIHATFTEPGYTRYYLKPENSFHFNCQTQKDMAHLCRNFHDLMVNELDITEFEFPDNGYNSYTGESSDTERLNLSRFYTYDTVDEFHKAGALLESFTHEYMGDAQGSSLSIYNWRNERYLSWAF